MRRFCCVQPCARIVDRLAAYRPAPLAAPVYSLPTRTRIDLPLVGGSVIFGVGWGIAGFCPGGAIPALGFGGVTVIAFVGAMMIGIVMALSVDALRHKPAKAF